METVVLGANQPGVQKYKVQITTSAAEDIATNNYQNAYVEVLDGRKSVLLLYQGPHPDIKALKTVIENNKNYQVEVSPIEKFTGAIR
jgi:flagellin-specific chaperone FliS